MPAPVVHFVIGCKDIAKAKAFYAAAFGWEFMAFGDSTAMIGNLGQHCPTPTTGIGGHINSLGHPPHNYVTVYAQADDIAASLATIEKLGGKTIVPQQEVPGMGHHDLHPPTPSQDRSVSLCARLRERCGQSAAVWHGVSESRIADDG